MRWKAIWCLLWHDHQKFNDRVNLYEIVGVQPVGAPRKLRRPSAFCRKCGMYFRWPVQ